LPYSNLPEKSAQALSRCSEKLPPALAGALPDLLADSPDPDSAALLFDRLLHESPAEILPLLERHKQLPHYALIVFGYSRFLSETLLQNTDLLQCFLQKQYLHQGLTSDELRADLARLRSHSAQPDISMLLALFKRREYIRIMLRDVLGIAPLAETTAEISTLADVLIGAALDEAHQRMRTRYAQPGDGVSIQFSVLALGKLGGNELNYSSDVDLLYLYSETPESVYPTISNREYCIRLAQHLTEILSRVTREGPVFRIDLRLRPQGSQGELAITLAHAIDYYAAAAHDWERQALIKARHCAGEVPLSRAFLRGVEPYVYTKALNLAAIGTALKTRSQISGRQPSALNRVGVDIKRDRGGLRDIEFLVQCLQRVYGGAEPWLRSVGTLFSLQKLHDKHHISSKDFQELTSAYIFLRYLEHRLQLRQGQQVHRLPASEAELQSLQRSLPVTAHDSNQNSLITQVERRMAAVAEIYQRVIHQEPAVPGLNGSASYQLRSASAWPEPNRSNQEILQRLAEDSPALQEIAARGNLSTQAHKNLFRFLSSALTTSERYAMVLRYPEALPRALSLFDSSDYLTQILIRHPEEIATLADLPVTPASSGSGYLFDSQLGQPRSARDPIFGYIASSPGDDGEKLSLLRRHYRHRVFASGARDITELRDVYTSLAANTTAAEDAIATAYAIAGSLPNLAVMALGRLGSTEFDLLSDADLLFVCADSADRLTCTKSAERIVQALAAYTHDGAVFPVDTRLRPRGREGDLLVSPSQLAAYCAQEAQPWEALMYTKLRYLAGSRTLADRAISATRDLFLRSAGDSDFVSAVREMRDKLETADLDKTLKHSAGGIYDIDFLCTFLLVTNRLGNKQGTLRDRLWRIVAAGFIPKPDAALLDHAAELLLTTDHVFRLVVGRPGAWLPASERSWQVAQRLISSILRREFRPGLESELQETCRQVRSLYQRLVR